MANTFIAMNALEFRRKFTELTGADCQIRLDERHKSIICVFGRGYAKTRWFDKHMYGYIQLMRDYEKVLQGWTFATKEESSDGELIT